MPISDCFHCSSLVSPWLVSHMEQSYRNEDESHLEGKTKTDAEMCRPDLSDIVNIISRKERDVDGKERTQVKTTNKVHFHGKTPKGVLESITAIQMNKQNISRREKVHEKTCQTN